MTILWCGGEEVDFPNNKNAGIANETTVGLYRSNFSRGALNITTQDSVSPGESNSFPGGAITSGWFSAQWIIDLATTSANGKKWGLKKSGTLGGLFVGLSATNKLAVFKRDSDGTQTTVISETGTTTLADVLYHVVVQFTGFDTATGTIKVWRSGTLLIDSPTSNPSGLDLSVTGLTELDRFTMIGGGTGTSEWWISECIVADEDIRLASLKTLAPNAAGDSNTFTSGSYTEIDEVSLDTQDVINSTVAGQEFTCNLTGMPTGQFVVRAVKTAFYTARGTSGIDALATGVRTSSTNHFDTMAIVDTGYELRERMLNTNPVTSGSWTTDEIDALQLICETDDL